jgi:hypothetical protein
MLTACTNCRRRLLQATPGASAVLLHCMPAMHCALLTLHKTMLTCSSVISAPGYRGWCSRPWRSAMSEGRSESCNAARRAPGHNKLVTNRVLIRFAPECHPAGPSAGKRQLCSLHTVCSLPPPLPRGVSDPTWSSSSPSKGPDNGSRKSSSSSGMSKQQAKGALSKSPCVKEVDRCTWRAAGCCCWLLLSWPAMADCCHTLLEMQHVRDL